MNVKPFPCGVCGKMIHRGWFAPGIAGGPPNPVKCGACCNPPRPEESRWLEESGAAISNKIPGETFQERFSRWMANLDWAAEHADWRVVNEVRHDMKDVYIKGKL